MTKKKEEDMDSKFICSECGARVDGVIAGWCMDCVKNRRANSVFTSHQTCSKCRKDFSVSRYVGDTIPYPFVCFECQEKAAQPQEPKPQYFCVVSVDEDENRRTQIYEVEGNFGESVNRILKQDYWGYTPDDHSDLIEPSTFAVFKCEPIEVEMEVSYKVKT